MFRKFKEFIERLVGRKNCIVYPMYDDFEDALQEEECDIILIRKVVK